MDKLDTLVRTYHDASTRLLLLDYDGTLTPIVKDPEAALPSKELLNALHILTEDRRNVVFIISGRDENFLSKHLGHLRGIGFSAEHGCFVKQPGSDQWANLTKDMDLGWMRKVVEIFEYYTEHTPGTSIEHKKSSITWHYRNAADPDLGSTQADQCKVSLENMIKEHNLAVDVLVGKKNLEVRPFAINKGEIVKRILHQHAEDVDFVFSAGDDKTDEDMFRALASLEPVGEQNGEASTSTLTEDIDSLPLVMSPPAPLGLGWTAEGAPTSTQSSIHQSPPAISTTSPPLAHSKASSSEASSSSISLQSSVSTQDSIGASTSADNATTTTSSATSAASSAFESPSHAHDQQQQQQLGLAVDVDEQANAGSRPPVQLPKLRKKNVFTTLVGPSGTETLATWRVDGPEMVIGCLVGMASRGGD
ncbi:hypothetical protein V8E36_000107 [Tilletia maclaganii]